MELAIECATSIASIKSNKDSINDEATGEHRGINNTPFHNELPGVHQNTDYAESIGNSDEGNSTPATSNLLYKLFHKCTGRLGGNSSGGPIYGELTKGSI
jgi:hypothetical protein